MPISANPVGYQVAHRPNPLHDYTGVGATQFIPEPDAPECINFWHPALPNVVHVQGHDFSGIWFHSVAAPQPTIRTSTGGGWMWRGSLAALLLALTIPALAHAEEPCKVNVQTCSVVSCAFLPGVGQTKGAAISQAHPKNEEELLAVDGIGEKTIEKMRPFLAFQGETTCKAKQTAPKGKDGAK